MSHEHVRWASSGGVPGIPVAGLLRLRMRAPEKHRISRSPSSARLLLSLSLARLSDSSAHAAHGVAVHMMANQCSPMIFGFDSSHSVACGGTGCPPIPAQQSRCARRECGRDDPHNQSSLSGESILVLVPTVAQFFEVDCGMCLCVLKIEWQYFRRAVGRARQFDYFLTWAPQALTESVVLGTAMKAPMLPARRLFAVSFPRMPIDPSDASIETVAPCGHMLA